MKKSYSKRSLLLFFIILLSIEIVLIVFIVKMKALSAGLAAESDRQVSLELDDKYELSFYRSREENIVTDDKTDNQYVNNELVLTAELNTSKADIEEVVSEYGGRIVGTDSIVNTYQILFENEYTFSELEELAENLKSRLPLAEAIPNYVINIELNDYPDDSRWSDDWDEIPGGRNWGLEAINVPQMWDYYKSTNSSYINVGVLDNQFYTDHEDLDFKDTFLNNFDLYAETKNPNHGTHVAGTIAAKLDNGIGISGIVPKVNLYGASMLGLANRGVKEDAYGLTVSEYEAGLVYLICLKECRVINLSYGGGKYSIPWVVMDHLETCLLSLIDEGFDFLISKAAGNDRKDYQDYDAFTLFSDQRVLDRIITVGAAKIGSDGQIYVGEYSNYGTEVDIIAPGSDIDSTICSDRALFNWGLGWYYSDYGLMSKTSMAAPHVAGVAAAIWSTRPDLTGPQIKEILCSTASGEYDYEETIQTVTINGTTNKSSENLLSNYTYPILNAYEAIKAAASFEDDNLEEDTQATEKKSIDVSTLPESLADFLNIFDFAYFTEDESREYDCNNLEMVFNYFPKRIVGNPTCVDISLYPGEDFISNREKYSDPLGMYSKGLGYVALPKAKTLWIMENVFNISQDEAEAMIKATENEDPVFYEYENDGTTYLYNNNLGGVGGPAFNITYEMAKFDGEKYYIIYNRTLDNTVEGIEPNKYYAELELKEIDGLEYWSLYRHTEKIPEKNTDTADETTWSDMYYHLIKDGDYLTNAREEVPLALHDFDMDGVPELIIGSIGARLGLEVFTIHNGKVEHAGGIGGKYTFYSNNELYHGIFRNDSWNGTQVLGYTSLSDGKLVNYDVIFGELNLNTKEFDYTVLDKTLYDVYLDCTISDSDEISTNRKAKNELQLHTWGEIESEGWDSFVHSYGF